MEVNSRSMSAGLAGSHKLKRCNANACDSNVKFLLYQGLSNRAMNAFKDTQTQFVLIFIDGFYRKI